MATIIISVVIVGDKGIVKEAHGLAEEVGVEEVIEV